MKKQNKKTKQIQLKMIKDLPKMETHEKILLDKPQTQRKQKSMFLINFNKLNVCNETMEMY